MTPNPLGSLLVSWWITRTTQILCEKVPAPPEQVRDFYADLNNLKTVHPLIVSVRTTARRENSDGYEQTYRICDRIPLRGFAIRIGYQAHLRVYTHGKVITEARQFPRVRLTGMVSFELVDSGTLVTERLWIQAPRPLAGITNREAVKAHRAMLSGIRSHFETRS